VIDIDAIATNRDQLWAEAVAAFNAGEPWHLTPEEDALLGKIQRAFEAADPWEDAVLAQASLASNGISIADLLGGALEKKRGFWTRNDEMRVAAILRRAGFKRKSLHRQRLWFPPGDSAATAATSSMKPTDYEYLFSDDASVAPDAAVAALAPKAEE